VSKKEDIIRRVQKAGSCWMTPVDGDNGAMKNFV
jgi:hypothetical protein